MASEAARSRILAHVLEAGGPVDARTIAGKFDMGYSTVTEALRDLWHLGVIERRDGRGRGPNGIDGQTTWSKPRAAEPPKKQPVDPPEFRKRKPRQAATQTPSAPDERAATGLDQTPGYDPLTEPSGVSHGDVSGPESGGAAAVPPRQESKGTTAGQDAGHRRAPGALLPLPRTYSHLDRRVYEYLAANPGEHSAYSLCQALGLRLSIATGTCLRLSAANHIRRIPNPIERLASRYSSR